MYTVFFGNDTVSVREHAQKKINEYAKKGFSVNRIDADNYTQGVLADIAGASSLFGTDTLYVIDTPSTQKDFYNEVLASLDALAQSENEVIVIENALLATEKKRFAKFAKEIDEYKKVATERFNVFGMADSLSRKDKKTLWLQLQEAQKEGLVAEEIIGTLWWQLKTLRLANVTANAQEAGMKDFPYNKAKRALLNFKERELEQLSRSLLAVYHDGHGGKKDINLALEKWVLTL